MPRQTNSKTARSASAANFGAGILSIEQLEQRLDLLGFNIMSTAINMPMTQDVDIARMTVSATDYKDDTQPSDNLIAHLRQRAQEQMAALAEETRRISDAKELEDIASRLPDRARFAAIAAPPNSEWLADRSWSR